MSHVNPGILTAVLATVAWAVQESSAGAIAAGIAVIAVISWLGLYLRVAAPINRALTAAAVAHVTPGNARVLQARWDSIITPRALLMAVAVAGLAVSAATRERPGSRTGASSASSAAVPGAPDSPPGPSMH